MIFGEFSGGFVVLWFCVDTVMRMARLDPFTILLRLQTPQNCFTFHELQHVQKTCFSDGADILGKNHHSIY